MHVHVQMRACVRACAPTSAARPRLPTAPPRATGAPGKGSRVCPPDRCSGATAGAAQQALLFMDVLRCGHALGELVHRFR